MDLYPLIYIFGQPVRDSKTKKGELPFKPPTEAIKG
jgi:hypothetical protein